MRKYFSIFLKIYLWWVIYFAGARLLFMLYHFDRATGLTPVEWTRVFWYGMQMDLSMGGYFMVSTGLLLSFTVLLKKNLVPVIHIINFCFILLSSFLIVADAELYLHWGFRLTTAPLLYLDNEATGTLPVSRYVMLTVLWLFFLSLSLSIYFRLTRTAKDGFKYVYPRAYSLIFFLLTALLFIPIRGSFQVSTMNVSRVYFHPGKPFANHAGINAVWNFLYSAVRSKALKYPEDFFDRKLTDEYFRQLYPQQEAAPVVLSITRPNILLIILEGISADVVEPLGGLPGIMPNLNKLCGEGLLFSRFYANGDRTDKGLVSLLAAYPAQPYGSIIKYAHKTQKLSYLSESLATLGYNASLVYGGDVDFANYRSLFTNGRFLHLTALDDFPDSIATNKWGVHDEHLYTQLLYELDTATSLPFFKVALTLSSHEPFNVPMQPVFGLSSDSALYLNAAFYADFCLGKFITEAKKRKWWNNTLVIITADHGHRLPARREPEQPEKYHIPMLWTGGAISDKGIIDIYGNQTDLANTLLSQLDKPGEAFLFSKNLLGSPVNNFAVFVFNEGFGYITPDTQLIYHLSVRQFTHTSGNASLLHKNRAKAYMQKLFFDYNNKK
ncbi:MAG: sulfatase [Cyclobacteriaceae bacterium]|nr:MAG: sulfatase [Cyclobacteriaceae bacterium]